MFHYVQLIMTTVLKYLIFGDLSEGLLISETFLDLLQDRIGHYLLCSFSFSTLNLTSCLKAYALVRNTVKQAI